MVGELEEKNTYDAATVMNKAIQKEEKYKIKQERENKNETAIKERIENKFRHL